MLNPEKVAVFLALVDKFSKPCPEYKFRAGSCKGAKYFCEEFQKFVEEVKEKSPEDNDNRKKVLAFNANFSIHPYEGEVWVVERNPDWLPYMKDSLKC